MNSLSLAYVGDAVFELFVRTDLMDPYKKAHGLHVESSKLVNAKAQAEFLNKLLPDLTDEELGVVNRAKNSKNFTMPKNASLNDYKMATALEALFGFHYLMKNDDRLLELYELGRKK